MTARTHSDGSADVGTSAVTMRSNTPAWLTVTEAAARARCGVRVVYRAVHRGKLRAARISDRGDLRFRPEWIDTWIDATAEPRE
jgi:excisionase family DNA binding protein